METKPMDILEVAVQLFKAARATTIQAAEALYQVLEQDAWKGKYGSFSEFVEDELQISKGYASQLISVYRHYVLEGGVQQAKLGDVDASKLYLAIKLDEPAEKKVEIAKTLSRRDLKEVRNEKEPCSHAHTGKICFDCHLKLD